MSAARPETGATSDPVEQLARMAYRLKTGKSLDHFLRFEGGDERVADVFREIAKGWLEKLIPPGSVIALAEHVVDADDRKAIGFAAAVVRYVIEGSKDGDEFCTESLQEALHYYPNDEGYQVHLARLERLGSGGEDVK